MFASSLSTWIGTLTGRANRRARRSRPAARRPLAVESLEARTVPTVYTWLPTAPGTYAWNDTANWSSATGSFPQQAGDVANITSAAVGNQVINLSTPVAVGALNIGSSGAGAGGFTVIGNGNSLTLQDPSNAPSVSSLAGDGDAILAPVTFLGTLTVTNGSAAPVSFFGPITANGSGILSVTGTGVVAFPEAQSLAANITLAGNGTVTYPTPLFATSYFDSALYAFDAATGATLATLIAPSYSVGPLLSGPAGVTVGPDGNLYVSSQSNDAILQFDLSTYKLNTFISQASMTAARLGTMNPNQLFAPAGLRYGPDGDLYVSLNGGQTSTGNGAVIRFDVTNTGGVLSYVPTATSYAQVVGGLQQPTGLTFGRPGDDTSLYVSYGGLTGFGGVVQVNNATTTPVPDFTFIPLGTGGLSTAAGLTWGVGSDNTLYVADLAALQQQFPTIYSGKVLQYDAGGGFLRQFNQSSLATKFPSDVLFDAQGRLLVAELGPTRPPATTGQIDLLNPNGSYNRLLVPSSQFPNTGTQPGVGTTSGITPSALTLLPLPAAGVTIDGTLNPGGAGVPGTLTTPTLTFTGTGSTFAITLNGTAPGTGYGNLAATGTVTLNSTNLATNVAAGFTAPLGSQYVIVSAPTITGTFNGLSDGSLFTSSGQQFQINYIDGTGGANDRVVLTRVAAPVFTTGNSATFYTRLFASFQVSATGFPAPTYFVSAGTLPSGVTLNANTGVLSGSANPGSEGPYNFTITAANTILPNATQNFTLTILTGVNPAFTSATSAIFTTGTGGTFTVTATGAPTPVLALTTTPPTGVSFDPANGVLTVGATTASGTYNLTFTATNGLSQASQAFTLTVGTAPAITSANNTTFYTSRANAFTVQTTGFPTPQLSVVSGTLPTGVTLTGSLLSGTPTSTGTFTFTIRANNALGFFDQAFTLTVDTGVAPVITSANTFAVTSGSAGTFTVTATGTPTPVLGQTQTLPPGVTFDAASGQLAVAASTASGTYNLAFTANNGVSPSAFQSFTLIVGIPPAITSANNTTFTAGQQGNFQVTASGVPAPTFSVFNGTLPAGVTLSSSGLLSGMTSATGVSLITIRATNALGVVDQNFTLTVAQAPVITSANNATFAVNTAGSFQVMTAAGTFPAATYSIDNSVVVVVPGATAGLPNGVTLNPTTGLLSGTPTQSGLFSFRIVAANSAGSFGQDFTLTVTQLPAITSANSATFFTGATESFQVTATGFPAPTFSIVSGTLPNGVTLNATTGVLGGVPTQAGTFNLTIRAKNSVGQADQPFTLTVITGAAPAFTSPATADVTAGVGGTFVVTASGSPAPTLAATTALPTGVTFTPATGVLTVDDTTPAGAYAITFTADNGVAPAATQNFVLNVNQAPAITSAAATTFTAGVAGSFQVTTTGFPVPILAVTGTLPVGVIFDAGTGRLVGTPAAGTGGVYTLSVTATNSQGTATQPFVLTVNQIPAFTSAAGATFRGGSGGTFTVTATGFPTPVLAQTAVLPTGVTFNASTGVLTVADTTFPGAYPLTFTATSSAGQTTQAFTLTVSAPPTGPVARLAVGGPTDGSASLYDQGGTGLYNVTPTAIVSPFGPIAASVRTAVADVNGDGIDDTILVTGPGVVTLFAVVNGADNATLLVAPTNPFLGTFGFTGGGYVAAGDFDLDGRADIVITPDQSGGPRVVILSLLSGGLTQRASFLGIDDANFRGGARPAVGDVNADGVPDLVVMAGFGGGPRVALYSGATVFSGFPQKVVNDFFAFEPNLRNGAYAAVGDLTGDGVGDLIFGAGPGGAPRVLALDGATVVAFGGDAAKSAPAANFFVNNNESTRGGVRVATKSIVGSDDIALVVGSGENDPSRVKVYPHAAGAVNGEPLSAQTLDPFARVLAGGVFVG